MQINGVNSFSYAQSFRGEETPEAKKFDKKKAAIAAGAGAVAAAAIGTTAYALHRGKLVAPQDSKFFTKIKEGFKTFAGEGRKNYLETLKANLQDMIQNGKKAKDGTVEKLSKDAIESAQNRINNLNKKINRINENLAKKAEQAAQEGAKNLEEAGEQVAQAAAEVAQ